MLHMSQYATRQVKITENQWEFQSLEDFGKANFNKMSQPLHSEEREWNPQRML